MKQAILQAIFDQAQRDPLRPALMGPEVTLNYAQVCDHVETLAEHFKVMRPRAIALQAENALVWVMADLAAARAGIPMIPVPTFFSVSQTRHVLNDAGVDLLLVDEAHRFESISGGVSEHFCLRFGRDFVLLGRACVPTNQPDLTDVSKVTYTSGSTGQPKGVCLSDANLFRVAEALQARTEYSGSDRHCCLLPLSTLLENIAGVYLPLMSGASVCLWPDAARGIAGAQLADAKAMHDHLFETEASSVILTPGLLQALVCAIETSGDPLPSLRVVAVGGAMVTPSLMQRAIGVGLPVIQGYGLSECASVVSLNAPGDPPVATGKALSHVSIEISDASEVLVHGNAFLGYLGQPRLDPEQPWPTGDLGFLDQEGRLHITGRKRNVIITDQGRNVSPEWVEQALVSQGMTQAAVIGEARPYLVAVLAVEAEMQDAQVQSRVNRANEQLPDYARVCGWVRSQEPFSLANGQLSPKAEPVRDVIEVKYAEMIDSLYSLQEPSYGVL